MIRLTVENGVVKDYDPESDAALQVFYPETLGGISYYFTDEKIEKYVVELDLEKNIGPDSK